MKVIKYKGKERGFAGLCAFVKGMICGISGESILILAQTRRLLTSIDVASDTSYINVYVGYHRIRRISRFILGTHGLIHRKLL